MVRDIRFYKTNSLPTRPIKDAVIAVLNNTQDNFSLYITDINGVPVPLYSVSGGGGTIQTITNNDGSITITGTDEDKVITISSAMQSLINGALQNGDNITSLVNNAGYITLSDIPSFDPSNYDLTDFTNSDSDPFIRNSDLSVLGTNLGYTPSSNQGTVTSDTGSDATIPLATSTNAGLLSPNEKGLIEDALQPNNNLSDVDDAEEVRLNLGLEIGVDVLAPNGSAANLTNFPTLNQNTTGSAASLTTERNINGTPFDGSQNITTSYWGTSRNLSIGGTSKAVDGSSNVTWSTSEIGITKSNIDSLGINATTLNGTANYQLTSQKGQANGYAPLDSGGKVPMTHLPDAVFGTVIFGGTYDGNTIVSASSSFPELQGEALPDADDYPGVYFISVASYTIGTDDYEIGDWIISTGIEWVKVDNVDAVISYNGRIGDIIPIVEDYEDFYEPIIATKNTAFNKNFGTTSGTVAEGNHTHTFASLTSKPTTIAGYGITDAVTLNTAQSISATKSFSASGNNNRIEVANSGSGYGIYSTNSSTGVGIVANNTSTGTGIVANNTTTGVGIRANNTSTGTGIVSDGGTFSYGNVYEGRNNNTTTFAVTKEGNITANSFAKTGGTSSEFLKADGSVDSNAYEPFFSKNTGFNKNFGTTAGTVSEGNHTHTFASLTSKPTTISGYGITDFNSLGDTRWLQLTGGTLTGNTYVNRGTQSGVLGVKRTISAIEYYGEIAINGGNGNPIFQSSKGSYIELGNSADVNGLRYYNGSNYSTVWNSLNDGTGSGLDADLLRGVHWGNVNTDIINISNSGVKYRSQNTVGGYLEIGVTANSTSRGFINFTNGLDIGGNVVTSGNLTANSFIKSGGTSSQFLKADGSVDNNTYSTTSHTHTFASLTSKPTTIAGYGITDFNSLGDARWLRLTGGSLTGAVSSTSTFTGTNFILSSDRRLKENIKKYKVKDIPIKLKTYKLKGSDSEDIGVIAQELEKTNPEFVVTNEDGMKSVKYIQMLLAKIAELEERIEKLEK